MRRTLVLLALAALGVALVTTIEAPRRPTARELVHGARPLRTTARAMRRIEVRIGSRHVVAVRAADGSWQRDGAAPDPRFAAAVDALAHELEDARAIDAFRTANPAALGLDPPAGSIGITTARGPERLDLGSLNTAGSTVYARRAGHRRALQLGVYLLQVAQRVADAAEPAP